MNRLNITSLLLVALLLTSCKIIQQVPQGGYVLSASGSVDCGAMESCTIDVENGSAYSETFTAVPNEGFRFVGWGPSLPGEYASLCAGTLSPCLVDVPGTWSAFDIDTYLLPMFEPLTASLNITELSVAEKNMLWEDISALDFNDDGFMDLLVQGTREEPFYQGNFIIALINNKDGTFTEKTEEYFPGYDSSTWGWVSRTFLVDLNNDGKIDMVPYGTGTVPPLIRDPNGSFLPLDDPAFRHDNRTSIPMDIDNDGDVDILRMNISWDEELDPTAQVETLTVIRLLENTSTGSGDTSFVEHAGAINDNLLPGWENNILLRMPLVSDVNNDNYPDLIYQGPHYQDGWTGNQMPVIVFLNNGNNQLVESGARVFGGDIPHFTHNSDIEAADIDGSGFDSIVLANSGFDVAPWPGEPNLILRNVGGGKLEVDSGSSDNHNYLGFTHSMTVGDIDNDGDIDIVYVGGGQDVAEYPIYLGPEEGSVIRTEAIRILLNNGQGEFSNTSFLWEGPFQSGDGWTTCLLADLNNDGYPELIVGAGDSRSKSFVLWNDGTGQYTTSEFEVRD